MKIEDAMKTKKFLPWMRLEILQAKSEKEALELILDGDGAWFPWQQDAYCEWYEANRGWLKEES